MPQECIDKVVGGILAGWRYDISGIAPEMCGDYEQHLRDCRHCHGKQRLHRTIDISLIALASLSAVLFLLAFGAIRYFDLKHALLLQLMALGGFAFSAVIWLIVLVSTPAPVVMADAAKLGARRLHDRLPEEIRNRLPQELRDRLPQ